MAQHLHTIGTVASRLEAEQSDPMDAEPHDPMDAFAPDIDVGDEDSEGLVRHPKRARSSEGRQHRHQRALGSSLPVGPKTFQETHNFADVLLVDLEKQLGGSVVRTLRMPCCSSR